MSLSSPGVSAADISGVPVSPVAPVAPAPPPPVRRLFGTDGVRGVANSELSPGIAMALGAAAAVTLAAEGPQGTIPEVVIGRDPRISGDLLAAALTAGLCSQGMNVLDIGVVPTPGVAFVTHARRAAAGIVISASHNPVRDNGIKFFGPNGKKLPDIIEAHIEAAMQEWEARPRPTAGAVGRLTRQEEPVQEYAHHLIETMGETRLEGMLFVVDCANGAASFLAESVLTTLGATVVPLFCTPDGVNINLDCGSLHPETMAARVAAEGADAGLAFDGDADRVILSDERGRIFDGDRTLCALAIYLASQGQLDNNVVVGTVMSNIGLEKALARYDIRLIRAPVGDRYVTEQMVAHGAVLGGEKSGHILLPRLSTTGDGLLTALQVLRLCRATGRSLGQWADEMQEFPQKLVNVLVRDREGWETDPAIQQPLRVAEERLLGRGRIFVRPSGTEKMIRVMAEGPDEAEVNTLVDSVADAIRVSRGI